MALPTLRSLAQLRIGAVSERGQQRDWEANEMNWEKSRFKGGYKLVCWSICAWITFRKDEPLHIGFQGDYLGTWDCSVDEAKTKLENMQAKILASN